MTVRKADAHAGLRLRSAQNSTFNGSINGRLKSARPVGTVPANLRNPTQGNSGNGGQIFRVADGVADVAPGEYLLDEAGGLWARNTSGWTALHAGGATVYPLTGAVSPASVSPGQVVMGDWSHSIAGESPYNRGNLLMGMNNNATLKGSIATLTDSVVHGAGYFAPYTDHNGLFIDGDSVDYPGYSYLVFNIRAQNVLQGHSFSYGRTNNYPATTTNPYSMWTSISSPHMLGQSVLIGALFDSESNAVSRLTTVGVANTITLSRTSPYYGTELSSGWTDYNGEDITMSSIVGHNNRINPDTPLTSIYVFGNGNTLDTAVPLDAYKYGAYNEGDWRPYGHIVAIGSNHDWEWKRQPGRNGTSAGVMGGNDVMIGYGAYLIDDEGYSEEYGTQFSDRVAIGTDVDIVGSANAVAIGHLASARIAYNAVALNGDVDGAASSIAILGAVYGAANNSGSSNNLPGAVTYAQDSSGWNSMAIGHQSYIYRASRAIALGRSADIREGAHYSLSLGYRNRIMAGAHGSMAIGYLNRITGKNSWIIGNAVAGDRDTPGNVTDGDEPAYWSTYPELSANEYGILGAKTVEIRRADRGRLAATDSSDYSTKLGLRTANNTLYTLGFSNAGALLVNGSTFGGVPSGGTADQVMTKLSSADGDAGWRDLPDGLPTGGTAGQTLIKNSATSGDATWQDFPEIPDPLPAGGSTGQTLIKNSSADGDVVWGTSTVSAYNDAVAEGFVGTREAWLESLKGEPGSLPSRRTASVTTTSLAASAVWSGTISMTMGYRLYRMTTSGPARVRIYATAAKRDADATRALGTDPIGDHGLIFEYVTTGAVLSAAMSPQVDGSSLEMIPDGNIAISVTNLSSITAAVTVSFDYLPTENTEPAASTGLLPLTRSTVTAAASSSIASGAQSVGAVGTSELFAIYRMMASGPCRVTLYSTTAQRDADAGRAVTVMPTGNHGVLLDVVFTADSLTLTASPLSWVYREGTSVAFRIQNLGTAAATPSVAFNCIEFGALA